MIPHNVFLFSCFLFLPLISASPFLPPYPLPLRREHEHGNIYTRDSIFPQLPIPDGSLVSIRTSLISAWNALLRLSSSEDTSTSSPHGDGDDGLTKEMVELLDKYAPVIFLASGERFFPSSVEYMFPHFNVLDEGGGDVRGPFADPLNATSLSSLGQQPLKHPYYLSISDPHNAQSPSFLDSDQSSFYLYGPGEGQRARRDRRFSSLSWLTRWFRWLRSTARAPFGIIYDGTTYGWDKSRGSVEEPIYAFHVNRGDGIVDLWYWTYYPYNLGKEVKPLGWLGNHVGDWERLMVRTKDGEAETVDYSAHIGIGAGTLRWPDAPKTPDGRPIAYSAEGSHGLWPEAGEHFYANILNLVRLSDITDDFGAVWDTKGKVVPIQWWADEKMMNRKRRHDNRCEAAWLNYGGKWGNVGDKHCWWNQLTDICQVVTGPSGPNRDFRVPPMCTIAPSKPSNIPYSTYTITLAQSAFNYSHRQGLTYLQLQQFCGDGLKITHTDTDTIMGGGEDQADNEDDEGKTTTELGPAVEAETNVSSAKEGVRLTENINRTFTIHIAGCSDRLSPSITSYRLALCDDNGKCNTRSPKRRICTFEPGLEGYTKASTADVVDPDVWAWAY